MAHNAALKPSQNKSLFTKNVKIVVLLLFLYLTRPMAASKRTTRVHRKPAVEPTNNIIFEKIDYKVHDEKMLEYFWVDIRPIARNVYKAIAIANLTIPIHQVWVHGIFYYKYQTY